MAFNDLISKTGKSLREIEKETGLSYSLLSRVLNNKVSPSFTTIYKLANNINGLMLKLVKPLWKQNHIELKSTLNQIKLLINVKKVMNNVSI